jgi:hypothetical protein
VPLPQPWQLPIVIHTFATCLSRPSESAMHPYRPYGPYREWLTADRDKRCTSRIAANLPTLLELGTN